LLKTAAPVDALSPLSGRSIVTAKPTQVGVIARSLTRAGCADLACEARDGLKVHCLAPASATSER
jgi:hypothetical protein